MNKIVNILNTSKKKAYAAVLCCALVLSIGTSGVLAASGHEKMLVKTENGVTSFSSNEGETWTKGTPEGFKETINKDGSSTTSVGIPPKDGEGHGMMVQNKNGVMSYSTDGGKTWSDKAPEGVTTTVGEDGSVMVQSK